MNRSLIAFLAAPLLLAACELAPVTPAATPVLPVPGTSGVVASGPGGAAVVVTPGTDGALTRTVVVQPTTVISTDISALAGRYDRSATQCRAAASDTRLTLTPSSMIIGGKVCQITGSARDGSSVRIGLSCNVDGAARAETVAVTRTAQGITLRQSGQQPMTYQLCAS